MSDPVDINIEYIASRNAGRFVVTVDNTSATIWSRIRSLVVSSNIDATITQTSVQLSWPDALNIVREFGSKVAQRNFNFRFRPDGTAAERLRVFSQEVQAARASQRELSAALTADEIEARLHTLNFTRRKLKP